MSKKIKFLKWSAPTMAIKEVVDAEGQLKVLTRPALPLQDKCGDLREVLNCIQPPKEWIENNIIWRQEVSNEPPTRHEVIYLAEKLDKALEKSHARTTGICEIREEIFKDLFDELIRQSTINCIERGLLLLRVRDEARNSIRAFHQLYISGVAYGIRKTLQTDEAIVILKEEADKLSEKKQTLETDLKNVRFTIAEKERELAERMQELVNKHKVQLEYQEETNTNLKYQLLAITSINKNKI